MGLLRRFRDALRDRVPVWLSDRRANTPSAPGGPPSKDETVGFRFLWAVTAPLDAGAQQLLEALRARFPGVGTATALPYIGRDRGILRGVDDTDADYAARLLGWVERWKIAGSAEALARAMHEYIPGHPMVRAISRAGRWVTVNADGSLVRHAATWDWDSVSHPERAGYWSELWVIIYPTPYAASGTLGDGRALSDADRGIGHMVARVDVDVVHRLLATWKSAHSLVRCVIWTTDASLFDPATPASRPDGTWGDWGKTVSGSRVSARNITTCRYWEPF